MREIGTRLSYYWGSDPYSNLSACGFTALNIPFADMRGEVYSLPEAEVRTKLEALYARIRDAGLRVNQTHGPCPTDDTTPESRARGFDMTLRAIRCTAWLHAQDLVIHPLLPWGHDAGDPAVTRDLNRERLLALLPYAREAGIRLDVENLPYPDSAISHMEALAELTEEIDDPALGLCLDTGHAACLGEDPAALIRRCGEKLYSTHVHDNNLKADLHLIPYAGRIDWEAVRAALAGIGYPGVVSLEVNMHPRIPEGMWETVRLWMRAAADRIAGN